MSQISIPGLARLPAAPNEWRCVVCGFSSHDRAAVIAHVDRKCGPMVMPDVFAESKRLFETPHVARAGRRRATVHEAIETDDEWIRRIECNGSNSNAESPS